MPTGLGAAGLWGTWMQERESAERQLELFSVQPELDDGFGPCPSRRGGRTVQPGSPAGAPALDGTGAPPAPADPWVGGSPPEHGARWPRLAFSPFSSKPMAVRVCPTPPAVRAPRPGLPGAWHRRVRSSEESLSVAGEAMKRGGVGRSRQKLS